MKLIKGKEIAELIKEEIAVRVKDHINAGGKVPHLAAVIVGNNPASETYVAHKVKACEKVGFRSSLIRIDENAQEQELLSRVEEINNDDSIDGLIVQLPLPDHMSEDKVIEKISHKKDVDGFHPVNVGRMVIGLPSYLPATPFGILELFRRSEIKTKGKHCVILGRSNIVGKPMAMLMSRKAEPGNCTVTMCHSSTENLTGICRTADIIISAMGTPGFVNADMVKEGAVVIDVGITRIKSEKTKSGWKLTGDVDFDNVAPKCSYITPVPGGVGPMTIVSLLENTLKAAGNKIYS